MPRKIAKPILSGDEQKVLATIAQSAEDNRMKERAAVILALAQGESPKAVAARLLISQDKVYFWTRQFQNRQDRGIPERLADGRSGRPRKHLQETIGVILTPKAIEQIVEVFGTGRVLKYLVSFTVRAWKHRKERYIIRDIKA